MKNETRFTDEEIKRAFKETKKTAELEVLEISYTHSDFYPDFYIVKTNKGKYFYQYVVKQNWNSQRNFNYYHRIVKTK